MGPVFQLNRPVIRTGSVAQPWQTFPLLPLGELCPRVIPEHRSLVSNCSRGLCTLILFFFFPPSLYQLSLHQLPLTNHLTPYIISNGWNERGVELSFFSPPPSSSFQLFVSRDSHHHRSSPSPSILNQSREKFRKQSRLLYPSRPRLLLYLSLLVTESIW